MKNIKSKSILVLFTIFLTLIMNTFSILAYNVPKEVENDYSSEGEILSFTPGSFNDKQDIYTFELSDTYFTSDSGYRIPIYPGNEYYEDKITCPHRWVEGTIEKHFKYSNGSCDIKIYNAKNCSICGKIIMGNLIQTIHYEKCPH